MTDSFNNAAKSLAQEAASLIEMMRVETVKKVVADIDRAGEDSLSDLAALAAQICMVPVATVTLIDDESQRHWGHFGLKPEMRCIGRDEGLCILTIQTPEINTIIYDASVDDRVKGLPVVNGTYDYIKFYAGMPLVMPDGAVIGTICVIDHLPRTLRKDQLAAMERLRKLVLRVLV